MLLVAHRTPFSPRRCRMLAQAGAQVYEIDIQEHGGQVVVSHFLPIPGTRGRFQHDNGRPRRAAAARDAELARVLGLLPPQARILLDLKEVHALDRALLVAALASHVVNRERFWVCSPRPDDLAALRDRGFATIRTIRNRGHLGEVLARPRLPDEGVSVRASLLDPDTIGRLHEVTPRIFAWTVNRIRRAYALRAMGVDGVTTDRRAVLRALKPMS